MTPDKIKNLPTASWTRADYDAHQALNQSGLKHLLVSPGHYQSNLQNPTKDSEALRVGRLTHMAVLQPDEFANLVVCEPEDAPKRPTEKQRNAKKPSTETLSAIQFWQTFDEQTTGKIVADHDEFRHAVAMAKSIQAELAHWGITHPNAGHKLSTHPIDQIQIVGSELCLTTVYSGVPLKSQIDFIGSDGYIYDLKTCRDTLTPNNVLRNVYAMGYHIQAAFYSMMCKQVFGERPNGVRLIYVEKDAPHATAIFELSSELIADGMTHVTTGIDAYKAAKEFNHWPFYPKTINMLTPKRLAQDNGTSGITFA